MNPISLRLPGWVTEVTTPNSPYSLPPKLDANSPDSLLHESLLRDNPQILGQKLLLYSGSSSTATGKTEKPKNAAKYRSDAWEPVEAKYFDHYVGLPPGGWDGFSLTKRRFVLSKEDLPQPFSEEFQLDCELRPTLCRLMWEIEREIVPMLLRDAPREPRVSLVVGERLQTAAKLCFHLLAGRGRFCERRALLVGEAEGVLGRGARKLTRLGAMVEMAVALGDEEASEEAPTGGRDSFGKARHYTLKNCDFCEDVDAHALCVWS